MVNLGQAVKPTRLPGSFGLRCTIFAKNDIVENTSRDKVIKEGLALSVLATWMALG